MILLHILESVTEDPWYKDIVLQLIAGGFGLLGLIITGFVIPWLLKKTKLVKDENAREALEQLITLAGGTIGGIVEATSQTLVKEYAEKGEWNAETKKIVLAHAIEQVKLALTGEQAAAIVAQTKMTLEAWITNKIEAYIHEYDPNKNIKPVA